MTTGKKRKKLGCVTVANVLITGAIDVGFCRNCSEEQINKAFANIKDILLSSDLTIGQLYNSSDSSNHDDLCLDALVTSLKKAGFDFMTTPRHTENNVEQLVCQGLDKHGVAGFSVDNHCALIDVHNVKLGLIQYVEESETSQKAGAIYSADRAKNDINNLKSAGAQFVICFVRWQSNSDNHTLIATELANAGVNYIVGHDTEGARCFKHMECADNRVIPVGYSLGNLLTNKTSADGASLVLNLWIKKDKYGNISIEDSYLPCLVHNSSAQQKTIIPATNRIWKDETLRKSLADCERYLSHLMMHYIPRSTYFDIPQAILPIKTDIPSFVLPEETAVIQQISQAMKFTEAFRENYGNYLLKTRPNGIVVRIAINAIRKFKHIDIVDKNEYAGLIKDLLYTRYVLGFLFYEYFCYGFEHKSISQRLEYVSQLASDAYNRRLNTNKEARKLFVDKYATAQKFKKYYKRDVLMISGEQDKERLLNFAQQHDRFILKPTNACGGSGVQIIDSSEYESKNDMLEHVIPLAPVMCEELITQAESINCFHFGSVNTVRVFTTMSTKGVPRIELSFMRFGTGSSVVDNAGAGGIFAVVDTSCGTIVTDGYDEIGNRYVVHPDSGKAFLGFKIEQWDELKDMLSEMALMIPDVRSIGWDCALSQDRGWQIVEGNTLGLINLLQIATGRGMKKEIDALFEIQ